MLAILAWTGGQEDGTHYTLEPTEYSAGALGRYLLARGGHRSQTPYTVLRKVN